MANIKAIKICVLSIFVIFIIYTCSACSVKNLSLEKNSIKKFLTVWGWGDFNRKAIETANRYYSKTSADVDIIYLDMPQNEIISKLTIAFSARDYDDLPDIALVEDYNIQLFLRRYPGEFMPMPKNVNPSDFMEFKIRPLIYNDIIYGTPFDSGAAVLFYRSDHISEAGYSRDDMNDLTWDKLIEIGIDVKKETGKAMLSIVPSEIEQIRLMMHSAGKWYVENDGKTINLANNNVLKIAINTYIKLIHSGIAMQIADYTYKTNDLVSGVVTTMLGGCWRTGQLISINEQSSKWSVTKIPRMAEINESVNFASIGGSSWQIIDKSNKADLAEDFIAKTFGCNLEFMNELADITHTVSAFKSAGLQPNYAKEFEFFGGNKILKEFFDWSLSVPSVNYGTNTFEIEKIISEVVQSVLQGVNLDEALTIAQVKAEAIYKN